MINATLSSLPFDVDVWRRRSKRASDVLWSLVSLSCGRGVLEEVEIPPYIQHASPRARRLVRQARVSPW
jgi:hypothetical protein